MHERHHVQHLMQQGVLGGGHKPCMQAQGRPTLCRSGYSMRTDDPEYATPLGGCKYGHCWTRANPASEDEEEIDL